MVAIASWTGLCKLWSIPDCQNIQTFSGHSANASSIVFHPESTLRLDPKVCNLVSTAFDGTVCLWNLEEYFNYFIILEKNQILFYFIIH
jgi:U4/U6 small nuclear ribonucleoprotein PRP4